MSISTRKKMTARLGLIPLSVYFATPAGLYFGITSFINLPRIVIVFIMIVGLGWMLNILHLWIRNKITLEENVIEIRSYVAFPFFDSWSVLWHPQTSRNKTIQLSTIIGIIIVTTTPLVQLRKSVSEINWRD